MTDSQMPYAAAPAGNKYSFIAMALAVLGVAAFPIIFGPAALVVSCVALTRNEQFWPFAAIVSAIGLVAGLMLWMFVFGQVSPFMG